SVMDASSWSIAREAPHEFAGFACLSASRVWFRSRPPRSAEIRRSVHVALPLFSTRGTGINNNMRSSGSTHNKGYGLLRRKLELPLPQTDGPLRGPSSSIMVREAPHEFVGFAGLCASRVWLRSRPQR